MQLISIMNKPSVEDAKDQLMPINHSTHCKVTSYHHLNSVPFNSLTLILSVKQLINSVDIVIMISTSQYICLNLVFLWDKKVLDTSADYLQLPVLFKHCDYWL